MPRKETNTGPISAQAQQDLVSEGIENFELPKTIVTKIAKAALPESAKLQKETVLSLVKGSTVFINYLAATAHDVALSKQHKSISASDVLKALEMIEFGDLIEGLQGELTVYREHAKNDKSKKASSGISSAPSIKIKPPAGPPTSASAPAPASGSKGKAKMSTMLSPFTTAPLDSSAGGGSISSGPGMAMDVDEEMVDGTVDDTELEGDIEGDMDGTDGIEDEEAEDENEDGAEVEEELTEMIEVEPEEMQRDGKALDEPVPPTPTAVDN